MNNPEESIVKKKIYVIACAVLARDIKEVAHELGLALETKFLEAGLHENPHKLNTQVQEAVDRIDSNEDADRIIIGLRGLRQRHGGVDRPDRAPGASKSA